jgi:hypothetical protein
MTEEKDTTARPQGGGSTKEEVALELMRFIASTTGLGKGSTTAGFGGKSLKTPDDQVEALLSLYERCRTVVNKKEE